ncbi:unnamed protein product, partial [Ectocarpus sp. 12 AP-2014]
LILCCLSVVQTPRFGYILSALLHMAHRQDEVAKNGDDILKLLELVSIEVGVKSGAMSKDALKSEVARKKKNLDKLNAVRESSQRTSARRLNDSTNLRPAPYRFWNTVANRPCQHLHTSVVWRVVDKTRKACFHELDALGHMSSHYYVVQVYGLIKDYMPDKLVLVMEYLQQGDLRNRLHKEQ